MWKYQYENQNLIVSNSKTNKARWSLIDFASTNKNEEEEMLANTAGSSKECSTN